MKKNLKISHIDIQIVKLFDHFMSNTQRAKENPKAEDIHTDDPESISPTFSLYPKSAAKVS